MGRISMPQGKGSQLHNRREYDKIGRPIPENIDTSLSVQNITLVDRDLKQAYEEIFGETLVEYNAKQKRADRKISDYYDHIQKSKNGEKLFYEDVVQWGKKEDFENDPEARFKAQKALVKYASTFEERNPNLKLIGAYIHMDEASPHLHLDYVPVAHGYTRGMKMRNSLDRAMKEMGFVPEKESRKNNATKLWKENERAYFGTLCQELGLEVEAERKARGSLSVEEYKEARDSMMADIVKEYDVKKAQVDSLDEIGSYIASTEIKAENFVQKEKKSFLGKIEAPERSGVFIENMDKEQAEDLIKRVKTEERIEDKVIKAEERRQEIIQKAHKEAEVIKASATAEKNETIAKAEQIIRNEKSIIQRAREWAEDLQRKCADFEDKVRELFNKKRELLKEVAELKNQKQELEPLRKEVEELQKARDILHGDLDNELTRARFRTLRPQESYTAYRDRGELVALYEDGTIRQVGSNENGGYDYKTLHDRTSGLCQVGIFEDEERVRVPKSLFKELLNVRDKSLAVTPNLANLIKQNEEVEKAVKRHKNIHR